MALAVAPVKEKATPARGRAVERAPQLPALTGLRFVAALFVVVHHVGIYDRYSAQRGLFDRFWGGGSAGVDIFFVLSGFILTYSYVAPDGAFRGTGRAYYVARLARIYPVYLLACALAFVPFLRTQPTSAHLLVTGASTLLLLQSWLPWAWVTTLDAPTWSLSVELLFYALLPFVTPWLARIRRPGALRCGLGVCWLLGMLLPVLCTPTALTAAGPVPLGVGGEIAWRDPPVRLPQFMFGLFLARVYVGRRQPPVATTHCLLVACSFMVLVLSMSGLIPDIVLHQGVVTPLAGLLIYALAWGNGSLARILSHPWALALGEASYALYLLHEPLWAWATGDGLIATANGRAYLFDGLFIAVAVGVSVLVSRGIERPARLWLRGALLRERDARHATGTAPQC